MAMIKCPECGRDVSDRANSCPNSGFPIASSKPNGSVMIKLSVLKSTARLNNQKVSISSGGKILWQGTSGEIAELYFDGATNITVKYHMSLNHHAGECTGVVDPAKTKRYNVTARQGIMCTKLVLQPVDVLDAD